MGTISRISEGWQRYRPTKADAFWIAVGSVLATMLIGFGLGGWVTGGTAQQMVSEAATQARNQLATAVCVDEFLGAANARTRLEKIKDAIYYERDDLVAAGGWATMPDQNGPDSEVAVLCASRLYQLKALPAPKATPASAVQSVSTVK